MLVEILGKIEIKLERKMEEIIRENKKFENSVRWRNYRKSGQNRKFCTDLFDVFQVLIKEKEILEDENFNLKQKILQI